jgi:hypothetical protein
MDGAGLIGLGGQPPFRAGLALASIPDAGYPKVGLRLAISLHHDLAYATLAGNNPTRGRATLMCAEKNMNNAAHPTQMSVDAFKKIVREGVQELCKSQGWNENKDGERGYAFQKWVGELIVQRERLEANVDEGMFLSGDLKIDVALEDADRKLLYLIQTKYVSLAQSPPIPEGEVVAFLDRHSDLLEHHQWVRQHANDQLLEYVGDYPQRLKDGWGGLLLFCVHWSGFA